MGDAARDSILIAEDSEEVREVLARFLARHGFRCETAADGMEAVQLFGDGSRFLCVVTDRDMPRLGGLAVIREIKTRAPEVPVVLMSSLLQADTSRAALELGAALVLDKNEGVLAVAARVKDLIAAAWKSA